MTSAYKLLLFSGTEHSHRNRDCIREWARENGLTLVQLKYLAADWCRKNYLTPEDARELCQ